MKWDEATIYDGQNLVNFEIKVDWQKILDWDIEAMNDYVENEFNKDRDDDVVLTNQSYDLLDREGDTLTFEVNALVEPMW